MRPNETHIEIQAEVERDSCYCVIEIKTNSTVTSEAAITICGVVVHSWQGPEPLSTGRGQTYQVCWHDGLGLQSEDKGSPNRREAKFRRYGYRVQPSQPGETRCSSEAAQPHPFGNIQFQTSAGHLIYPKLVGKALKVLTWSHLLLSFLTLNLTRLLVTKCRVC